MQNGGQVLACPPSANIQLYGSSILHPKGKQWFYIFKYASRKPGIWAAKNPDKIGVFAEHIFFMFLLWRSERDLNSRAVLPAYSLSRGAPSASWVSLRMKRQHMESRKKLAERVGFEPTAQFPESLVFKTSSLNRSDISPCSQGLCYFIIAIPDCQSQNRKLPEKLAPPPGRGGDG